MKLGDGGSAKRSLRESILINMPLLQFPTDRIVGTVDWDGSWNDEHGPVLATGTVHVPNGVRVSLEVQALRGSEPTGGGSWSDSGIEQLRNRLPAVDIG